MYDKIAEPLEKWCQPPNLGNTPASPFLVAGTFSLAAFSGPGD
jgi:hypothetical protein